MSFSSQASSAKSFSHSKISRIRKKKWSLRYYNFKIEQAFQFVFKIKFKWSEEITGTMGKYICNIKIFRYFH